MSTSENYRFHRKPRFSANQLAEYLFAGTASRRETVIRSAKFPRKSAVIPYTHAKRIIGDFLSENTGNLDAVDEALGRLQAKLRREPDGWTRDEIQRNINAIEAFKGAFKKSRMKRLAFAPGPADLVMNLDGVRINTRLDARLLETDEDGAAFGGGVVLFTASTDASRSRIDERSKVVAAMVHWSLEEAGGNIEPLAKLCLSFDVFGMKITKAPKAIDRLRSNIGSSCREVASSWDGVAPPRSYDGPDWQ